MDLLSALVGAVMALVLDRLAAGRFRSAEYRSLRSTVGGLYDRLVDYRERHPNVLRLSRQWKPECIASVYGQEDEEGREWALYYGYVELVIGYCNNVIIARKELISCGIYECYHRRLARLLITENLPCIQDLLGRERYVSALIGDFIQDEEKSGWNWTKENERLCIPTGWSAAS